jgi:drug/metabolite transporter (DMT)-like permease
MLLALAFAFFFAQFSPDFVTGDGGKAALYVLAAVLGPITVLLLRVMADLLHLDRRRFTTLAVAGAITFDGLFIGIWPDVYGHEGASLAVVAALILFGAAFILLSDQLLPISKFPNRKTPAR